MLEDPDFLVFTKPPGMETVSLEGGPELTALVRDMTGESGLAPVHRLDRDTSGAQLFARNPAAEQRLLQLFRQRHMEKTYLALCLGVPRNATGVINRNLSEWEGGRRPVRVLKKGGLPAATAYRVLGAAAFAAGSDGKPSERRAGLLAFFPHQGRTHQIRVHAAALGHPVLGDDQYGDRPANKEAKTSLGLRRQALHAWRLAFLWRGKTVEALCPLPDDMEAALRRLGIGPNALAALPPPAKGNP